MKTHIQNQFPYDSCILGLNGSYIVNGSSFLINAEFILATDKVVAVRKEYILFNYSAKAGIKMSNVTLHDCFYYEGNINLIVQDIRSKRVFTISQCLECTENDCTWILVDVNYFVDLKDAKAIRDYCNCGDTMSKAADDLLEFEF